MTLSKMAREVRDGNACTDRAFAYEYHVPTACPTVSLRAVVIDGEQDNMIGLDIVVQTGADQTALQFNRMLTSTEAVTLAQSIVSALTGQSQDVDMTAIYTASMEGNAILIASDTCGMSEVSQIVHLLLTANDARNLSNAIKRAVQFSGEMTRAARRAEKANKAR